MAQQPAAGHPAADHPAVKHGTSSVFMFARVGGGWRIGLIRHPRFGRAMMPGGHVETAESPGEAALREVAEESGRAVRLIGPPAPPMPSGYHPVRVAQPWWIVEYDVPPDGHRDSRHVHVDFLYVAIADDPGQVSEPAHPFGWYAPGDLPGLDMFPGARRLATSMLAGLEAVPARVDVAGPEAAAAGPHPLTTAIVAGLALG